MAQSARERRARVRRAAIPVLPDEPVVWEILVRVPAKELLRCRAVCRSWHRLTSAAHFLLAHHRRQPSLPLVSFRGLTPRTSRGNSIDALDAFDLRQSPAERRPVLCFNDRHHRRRYWVYASCDGLLVLSVSKDRSYYICNPATRQWISLPNLTCSNVLGVYPHGSSGEYRILYQKRARRDNNTFCYLLTVGSSMAPRVIENCQATGGLWHHTNYRSVSLHGRLHWVHCREMGTGVLVFDTVRESLTWMRSPTDDNCYEPSLLAMDGTLGISQIHDACVASMMKVWVLQDYETEVWLMKYRIQLPVLEMRSFGNYDFVDGMVLSENRDVLVFSPPSSHMFHCDSTGKLLQKNFHWDRVISEPTRLWFKESLVQHAFFQRNDGNRLRKANLESYLQFADIYVTNSKKSSLDLPNSSVRWCLLSTLKLKHSQMEEMEAQLS